MKNVKFRAWDTTCKRMYDCDIISDIFGYECWQDHEDGCPKSDVLMQYTGLLDKEGNEIYEGDIVKNYAFIDEVIFDKGIFTTKKSTEDKFGVKQPLAVHTELYVIGNIHRNPEFMEIRK